MTGLYDYYDGNYYIVDEIHEWIDATLSKKKAVQQKQPKEYSEIRVTFNRKLTWSERETFRERISSFAGYYAHEFNNDNPAQVYVLFYDTDSRLVSRYVSVIVEWEFLNVHPRAVKTIVPEVRV